MGYGSQQQQPYTSGASPTLGGRYGNYNGARFQNNGVGNSQRYGTQFKPGQNQPTPQMPPGMGYAGAGPSYMPPMDYSSPGPNQYNPQPQGNPLGRSMASPGGGNTLGRDPILMGREPNGWAGPPQQPQGGLGRPTGGGNPQAQAQYGPNANPMLASYFNSSNYANAPQQSNGYSFADQEAQLRQLYGF